MRVYQECIGFIRNYIANTIAVIIMKLMLLYYIEVFDRPYDNNGIVLHEGNICPHFGRLLYCMYTSLYLMPYRNISAK